MVPLRTLLARFVTAAALVSAVVASPSPASAQSNNNKLGFKVGEKSRLHLNLDISSAFDSNSLRREDLPGDDIDEGAGTEDVRILVRPSLSLDVPGRSVSFRLGLGTTIGQFLGTGADDSETTFGLDANIFLRIGSKKSMVSFQLENSPMLTPTVLDALGTVGTDERLFPAFTDNGRLFLTFRPGGGALEFDVGYKNSWVVFVRNSDRELVDAGGGSPDDGFVNKGFLEARLKFLPKTAAVFYADFGAFDVSNPDRLDTADVSTQTRESNPFSVLVGLIGQITRTISAEIRAGYAETLVWRPGGDRFSETDPANQRTVVGLASVGWQVIRTARISLSYQRDLQPTVALSSFITDAIRLRAKWNIDRLLLGAYGELQFRDFGTQAQLNNNEPEPPPANLEPASTLFFAGLRADYYFLDWLVGGLNYRVMIQDANDDSRGFRAPALGSFDRHLVFVNVGVRY